MAKIEKKEILQAVVMADNFNDHFKPFTSFNSPVNTQIIDEFFSPTFTNLFSFSVAVAARKCSADKLRAGNT